MMTGSDAEGDIDLFRTLARRLDIGQHKTGCPVCQDTRRKNRHDKPLSIEVRAEGCSFTCHHCGVTGGFDFEDKSKYRRSHRTVTPMRPKIDVPENIYLPAAGEFLEHRLIPKEVYEKYTISGEWSFHGERRKAVGFPYRMGGDVVAVKWRSADDDKLFSQQGVCDQLWNLESLDETKPLLICEGEIDALTWLALDDIDANIVSVPNGAPAKVQEDRDGKKFNYLWSARDALAKVDRIYISPDNDEPGANLVKEITTRVGKGKCWIIDLEGYKDANEAMAVRGGDWLKEKFISAQPIPLQGLYDSSHYLEKFHDLYDNGRAIGVSSGFVSLDAHFRISPGMVSVVTGLPGHGKSDWLDSCCISLAKNHGWSTIYCSFEKPPPLHMAQLAQKISGLPFFEGLSKRMNTSERDVAADWISEHFFFMDAAGPMTIDDVLEFAEAAVLRHSAKVLVIDPFNYLHVETKGQLETNAISEVLTKTAQFAKSHDVAVFFVSHPAKPGGEARSGKFVAGGMDVAGSMAWYAKADLGITIVRTEDGPEAHVWKVRWAWLGHPGMAELSYDPISTQWSDRAFVDDGFDWSLVENSFHRMVKKISNKQQDILEPPF